MTTPVPVEGRKLAAGSAVAVAVAAVVLLVAVLPAEYGIDPTGLGAAAGFARLAERSPAPIEEGAEGPVILHETRATWRLLSLPLAERAGYSARGGMEERITVPLRVVNLTSITATLTWNDTDRIGGALTQGDTLEISIRGPNGTRSQLAQATNEPGREANASAMLVLRSAPFPRRDGDALMLEGAPDTRGVGNYTFVVRLYGARGVEGSEEPDPGQAWTLRVTGEAYELGVSTLAERLGDRVRLTLAPRQGLEYKFDMRAEATMTYRWSASGALRSELHSDLASDPEDVITTKTLTASGDEGEYRAPRDGRHGWYWLNEGAQPVTLTLETRGDYRILGVV